MDKRVLSTSTKGRDNILIEGCEKLWDRHYVKKWGVDNGYIGDGWIAKTCLEKFL